LEAYANRLKLKAEYPVRLRRGFFYLLSI